MIDIQRIEEDVIIEANDFNMPLTELVNTIAYTNRGLSTDEVYKNASRIIGSMLKQEQVELVRTVFKDNGNDTFTPLSEHQLSEKESNIVLKQSEKWDDKDILSFTNVFQLKITDKGRERFKIIFKKCNGQFIC